MWASAVHMAGSANRAADKHAFAINTYDSSLSRLQTAYVHNLQDSLALHATMQPLQSKQPTRLQRGQQQQRLQQSPSKSLLLPSSGHSVAQPWHSALLRAAAAEPAAARLSPASLREEVPILHQQVNGRPLVYLDNAATSQKPLPVLSAMQEYYEQYNSNVHRGVHNLSTRATAAYEAARASIARLINAESDREIVFTRNASEAINLVAQTWGVANLKAGDEV